MADKNYRVSYEINVDAKSSISTIQQFANAISQINQAKTNFGVASENIQSFITKMDTFFRTGKGRPKKYAYKFDIDTKSAQAKLTNIGEKLDVINKKFSDKTKPLLNLNASGSMLRGVTENLDKDLKHITTMVGKVNRSLFAIDKPHELTINTENTQRKLTAVLNKLYQIKEVSGSIGMGGFTGPLPMTAGVANATRYSSPFGVVTAGVRGGRTPSEDSILKKEYAAQDKEHKAWYNKKIKNWEKFNKSEEARDNEYQRKRNAYESAVIKKELDEKKRVANEASKQQRQRDNESKRITRDRERESLRAEKAALQNQRDMRRSAIQRLTYGGLPSFRGMPMMGMLNGYMAYSIGRNELQDVLAYADLMTHSQNILKTSDNNLGTFGSRFESMRNNVRQVGIDTKYTSFEVADATKFLAMAGLDVDAINNAIRPITNLALIGDDNLGTIADYVTNIMTGYDIASKSMGQVSDILASTIARSNTTTTELAESYKMAAGFLNLSGVGFGESAAAFGVLGNMGMKGTMAGTAMRAMTTRFAKPTKEAQATLDRLGVKFTENVNMYGQTIERLRPLADIFEDLDKAKATLGDMGAIFGKIGGTAGMVFVNRHDDLRSLTNKNIASAGLAQSLAEKRQDTTKGLWAQFTSQFSEAFTQAYESLEPQIRQVLRGFMDSLADGRVAEGLKSIGNALLDVFNVVTKFGLWVGKNWNWIEPVLFGGVLLKQGVKFLGFLGNLKLAFGGLIKQAGGLMAVGKAWGMMQTAVTAKNVAGGVKGAGGVGQLLGDTIKNGGFPMGALGGLTAFGAKALAVTGIIGGLAAALTYVGYKAYQAREARAAVLEETNEKNKYSFPDLDALNAKLSETYRLALAANGAKTSLVTSTAEDATKAYGGGFWQGMKDVFAGGIYGWRVDADRQAIATKLLQDKPDMQSQIFADASKYTTAEGLKNFLSDSLSQYKPKSSTIDPSLYQKIKRYNRATGKLEEQMVYDHNLSRMPEDRLRNTPHYVGGWQTEVANPAIDIISGFAEALESPMKSQKLLKKMGYDVNALSGYGFQFNTSSNKWEYPTLSKNATQTERDKARANFDRANREASSFLGIASQHVGGNQDLVINLLKNAGIGRELFELSPMQNAISDNGVTFGGGGGRDDGGGGGNYSGSGKISSVAPKQVIVNITNLMSVQTISLMNGNKSPELDNAKEQMAQALIDVVKSFDAAWQG